MPVEPAPPEQDHRHVQPMLARQFSSSTETLMAQIFEGSNEHLISDENEAAVKQEENDASEEDYGAQLTGQAMPESEVTEEAITTAVGGDWRRGRRCRGGQR